MIVPEGQTVTSSEASERLRYDGAANSECIRFGNAKTEVCVSLLIIAWIWNSWLLQ